MAKLNHIKCKIWMKFIIWIKLITIFRDNLALAEQVVISGWNTSLPRTASVLSNTRSETLFLDYSNFDKNILFSCWNTIYAKVGYSFYYASSMVVWLLDYWKLAQTQSNIIFRLL